MFIHKFALSALAACSVALMINPAAAATAFTSTDVNLHSGPGAKFMTTGDVGANAKVGILWCGGADFAWCLIQFHNKQGWVSLSDLTGFGTKGSKSGGGTDGHGAQVAGDDPVGTLSSRKDYTQGSAPAQITSVGSKGVHAVGSGL